MRRLLFLFLLLLPLAAFAQFPNNPNKIRLGNQTTGLGLLQPSNGAPSWTPTTINNAWSAMDTTTGTIYAYFNSQWNALAAADGNGLFSVGNNGDTIRAQVIYIQPGGEFTYRDTAGTAFISLNENTATVTAGNAQIQAVKPLGYLLLQGDSLLLNTGGSYGTAGQVITATGDGGAFWQNLPAGTIIDSLTTTADSIFLYTSAGVFSDALPATGSYTGFTPAADATVGDNIASGDTLTFSGGYGINTSVTGTTVTIEADTSELATQYDLTQINTDNFANADLTFTGNRSHAAAGFSSTISGLSTFNLSGTGAFNLTNTSSGVQINTLRNDGGNVMSGHLLYQMQSQATVSSSTSTAFRLQVLSMQNNTRASRLNIAPSRASTFGASASITTFALDSLYGDVKPVGLGHSVGEYPSTYNVPAQVFTSGRTGMDLFAIELTGDTKFLFKEDATAVFSDYGAGNKEAADLSKTDSDYIAGYATDGTVIEIPKSSLTNTNLANTDLVNGSVYRTYTIPNTHTLDFIDQGGGNNFLARFSNRGFLTADKPTLLLQIRDSVSTNFSNLLLTPDSVDLFANKLTLKMPPLDATPTRLLTIDPSTREVKYVLKDSIGGSGGPANLAYTGTADVIELDAGGTPVYIAEGSGVDVTQSGDTLTIAASGGGVSGSGTTGTIPVWSGSTAIGDSPLTVTGTDVTAGGTGFFRPPVGTTAQQPGTPTAGMLRYNSTNGAMEYYGAAAWEVPLKSGTVTGLGTAGRVFYADANGRAAADDVLYWDATNNRLGINIASPIGALHQSLNGQNGIYFDSHSNTSTDRTVLTGRRSRGTAASPTAVTDNDLTFTFLNSVYSGTTWINSAAIDFDVNGTVTTSSVPVDIQFQTGATGTRTAKLLIRSDGMVQTTNGNFSRNAPVTKTGNFTVGIAENWLIVNNASANTTVTLPTASSWTGREIMLKNLSGTYTVISASSNVVPIDGTSAGTAILPATAGAWCTLVSDGTNWVIMQQ